MEPTMTRSNSAPALADVAEEIKEHEVSRRACEVKGMMHGLRVGELLLEAKKIVPHGQFSKWREEHTTVSQRMAQMFMTIARSPRITEPFIREYETVSHLTLQKAVQLTREPTNKTPLGHLKIINKSWGKAKQHAKDMGSVMDEARSEFQKHGGDEQFLDWLVKETPWPEDVARRILPPKGEPFDADQIADALVDHLVSAVEVGDQALAEPHT